MCRESLSAHSHAGPAAGNPPGSRLRPCTAVACCSRSSSSVAQQPRAMTASKREQAKGEARMRCSGSRAGNGCEPRMRRTWWPRPPAGLWGAGESGSQCIGGGVDAWTSKLSPSRASPQPEVLWSERYHCRRDVALAWGSESRDPEPTKKPQRPIPIANRQLPIAQWPNSGPSRRCGVAEPSWRCRQSAARRRMR